MARIAEFCVRFIFSRRWVVFWPLWLPCCSLVPQIPTIVDKPLEALVRQEASYIVAVTADRDEFPRYHFFLSRFPRKDILGLSTGNRRIYISHQLAALSARQPSYRWLLRQTLAHEIAHEIAGHANQREASFNPFTLGRGMSAEDIGLPRSVQFLHYSPKMELEADLEGMAYWARLRWDCRIWVEILEKYSQLKYRGDVFHPTEQRLRQALAACGPKSDPEPKRVAIEAESDHTER
jgi:hypothetical protein